MKCHSCGAELAPPPYFRRDECHACGADLHVCAMCRFHSPGSYNDCSEPQADRVVDKQKSNFCDFFEAGANAGGAAKNAKVEAMSKLDALFKK